ncbi:MAG TPA: calcium-binding protein [Thermoleophilaceae bacterium]|jgi:Ca2+-binding RTX toxin-like protein
MKHVQLAAVVAAVSLALPASASASKVDLLLGGNEDPSTIEYTAAAGEQNKLDVKVAADGRSAEISDPGAGTVTPGDNCTAQNAKKVTCTVTGTNPKLLTVYATLLDGNDTFDITGSGSSVNGGDGNDELRGGPLDDGLRGGGGTDELRGNAGSDALYDGDTSGAANKDTLDGGPGDDTVVYERTAGVVVDLADPAGDGEPGENDALVAIENVGGGSGNDQLRGDAGPNRLGGALGDDTIDGRAGDDWVTGFEGNDTLIGGPGRDDIEGGDGDDTLRLENPAGQYDRLLTCSAGKDTIVGITAAPSVEAGCETGDFGFGFVAGLRPKKVTTSSVTIKIPCPDAYRAGSACKGSVVVEPKGAYAKDAATRAKQRYGVKKFSIGGSSAKVTIALNSAGRKQLKKSAFKLQFSIRMKETATKTKRQFEWTSYVVRGTR